jgi:hypothetical protein
MEKVSLLFGVHMHQPVDNFGDAVDEAIALCYEPFFETMVQYKEFKFSVHCSGWLLDRIRVNHPNIFKNMKILTQCGAIEWIGAGYYEPVLSSIPSRDRVAQINKLSRYIKKHLGVTPKGLWLTERVWESSLVPDLAACDIEYAVVDDYHFLSSGFDASKMDGYYKTEEGGVELGLFPIAQSLRYALPFFSVERSIEAILDRSASPDSAAIIFDDAEKFGLWPKTHEWVYEKGWLEQFIEAVIAHERIVTEHYAHYMSTHRSLGLAYLNNTSYFEMGEWSLRAKQTLALEALKQSVGDEYFNTMGVTFIKGGIWKNFLIKYQESNYLHKRMLYFSKKQNTLNATSLDALYKLQTNDVFWHGVFGGLYLPNLRDNAYRYLLEIEKAQVDKKIKTEVLDLDSDGFDELKVLTPKLSAVFSSKYGGQMVEFGSLESLFNWQNTLMRREEAYHEKILNPTVSKEDVIHSDDEIATIHSDASLIDEDLKEQLIYDWHPKYSFVDHFCCEPLTLENFKTLTFKEVGDFANQPFELNEKKILFKREGGIYLDRLYETTLKKCYAFKSSALSCELNVKSDYKEQLFYACEFNFHFAHPHLVTFNGQTIDDGLTQSDMNELTIYDDFTEATLTLKTNHKCTILAHVLNTISQSESGFDKVAQGVSFIMTLPYSSDLKFKMDLEVSYV